MSTSILKIKNPTTGEWKEIPAIVGPTGPAGPQGQKGAQGETGPAGKNAYQYAQEGGYTGTEEEFANKLIEDNEIFYVTMTSIENQAYNFTSDKTAIEVIEAHNAGKVVKCKIDFNDFPLVLPLMFAKDNVVAYSGIGVGTAVWVVHSQNTGTLSSENYITIDDIPVALPNPNQLIFTGAANATYNGSQDVTIDIPLAGIPVPTVASVGQTIVVKAVDESGKPTAWEPVDIASSGGDTMEYIKTIKLTEEVSTVKINTDAEGNPLNLKRVVVAVKTIGGTPNENKSNYWVHPNSTNAGAIRIDVPQGVYAKDATVSSVVDIQMITSGVYLLNFSCNGNPKQTWGGYNSEPTIKEINFGVSTADYTFGLNTIFYVMGVKAE